MVAMAGANHNPAKMAGIVHVQSSDCVVNTLEDAFVEDKDHRISLLNQYKGTGIGLDNNLNSYRATKNKSIDIVGNINNNLDGAKGKNKSTYQSFISRFTRK